MIQCGCKGREKALSYVKQNLTGGHQSLLKSYRIFVQFVLTKVEGLLGGTLPSEKQDTWLMGCRQKCLE